jgi:hypothetical protein
LPRKRLSADESDALIERYAPLVRSIAQAIANLRAVVIDAEEPAKSLLAPRWRTN